MERSKAGLTQLIVLSAWMMCFGPLCFAQGAPTASPRVALKGYDTVAYFTERKPVQGTPEYRHDWDGARYHFASARNRDAFAADPDRYAPQFSGLCAASLSMGKIVEADPTLWKIIDGRLYVFGKITGIDMADKDPAVLKRSRQNWQAQR